jgi:hypothetical protein
MKKSRIRAPPQSQKIEIEKARKRKLGKRTFFPPLLVFVRCSRARKLSAERRETINIVASVRRPLKLIEMSVTMTLFRALTEKFALFLVRREQRRVSTFFQPYQQPD